MTYPFISGAQVNEDTLNLWAMNGQGLSSWGATRGDYFAAQLAMNINIADGKLHELSERFSSLQAAQVFYPSATSLKESFAWHAINRAIEIAASNGGGNVYLPQGIKSHLIMSPCPRSLSVPLCIDGAAVSQDTNNPLTNAQVNLIGAGSRNTCLQFNEETSDLYLLMCGQIAGDPINQQVNSRYGPGATSYGLFKGFWLIGPARQLLNGSNTIGVAGCQTHGICWASRRRMEDVRVTWCNRGLDLVGDHTDFSGCQFTHNYDGFFINHPSPTMYGDWIWSGKFQSRLNRRSGVAVEYTASFGPCQITGRPFIGTSPYAFYKVAPRAVGATTDAAGYAVGATSINLAATSGQGILTGDTIQFAGDATKYLVTNGDIDVGNGGTISFLPGLVQAIPTAATTITVNPGLTTTSALLVGVQADSLFLESCGNAYFWDGKADLGGTPTAVVARDVFNNITLSSFSDDYKIAGKDRCIANLGDMYDVVMGFSNYQDIWTGLTLPAFNLQNITGYVKITGDIETWISSTLAAGKQPIGLPSANAFTANRFLLEHQGKDSSVGPWKGCFQCTPTGSAINAGHAVGFGPGGVYLISATSVTRPFAGLARTAAFPLNPPTSGTVSFTVTAQDSPGPIPYIGGGTFTANTHKKLQTGGALQDGTDITTDLRVVGFASSTTRTSIFASSIGK